LKKNLYLFLKAQKQTLAYMDKLVHGISAKHLMKWLKIVNKKNNKLEENELIYSYLVCLIL
jgi:hypothetical protein